MIILSKANLVDEGIDLDQIKNSIREDSIMIGKNITDEFRPIINQLQDFHDKIQQAFLHLLDFFIIFILFYNRIIQPPSQTFAKPSLTN